MLLSYENEAIFVERRASRSSTSPRRRRSRSRTRSRCCQEQQERWSKANAFKNFLYTAEGAEALGRRPASARSTRGRRRSSPSDFPTPQKLWTIADLGGWKAVDTALFNKDNGSIAEIYDQATSRMTMTTETLTRQARPTPHRPQRGRPAAGPSRAPGRSAAAAAPAVAARHRRRRRSGSASSCCCRWPRSPSPSFDDGLAGFWDAVTAPAALASLRVTLLVSVVVALVNAVMGTLVAWVLVRDDFPGKRIVNALIDLPFALPTIVASIVLLSLYGPNSPVDIHLNAPSWGWSSRWCS